MPDSFNSVCPNGNSLVDSLDLDLKHAKELARREYEDWLADLLEAE